MRKLSWVNNEFVATTVAGTPTSPGNVDGNALKGAKLTFPSHITNSIDGQSVYFVEESANPTIRKYSEIDGRGEVNTLYRGSPLVTPGSLCFCDENNLLICDIGAACIWSFNVFTRRLTVKISNLNLFLHSVEMYSEIDVSTITAGVAVGAAAGGGPTYASAAAVSHSGAFAAKRNQSRIIPSRFMDSSAPNAKFSPVGIVRLSPGCFIFAAITTQRVEFFRYVTKEEIDREIPKTVTYMNAVTFLLIF